MRGVTCSSGGSDRAPRLVGTEGSGHTDRQTDRQQTETDKGGASAGSRSGEVAHGRREVRATDDTARVHPAYASTEEAGSDGRPAGDGGYVTDCIPLTALQSSGSS